jgi:hypothetical protein
MALVDGRSEERLGHPEALSALDGSTLLLPPAYLPQHPNQPPATKSGQRFI